MFHILIDINAIIDLKNKYRIIEQSNDINSFIYSAH